MVNDCCQKATVSWILNFCALRLWSWGWDSEPFCLPLGSTSRRQGERRWSFLTASCLSLSQAMLLLPGSSSVPCVAAESTWYFFFSMLQNQIPPVQWISSIKWNPIPLDPSFRFVKDSFFKPLNSCNHTKEICPLSPRTFPCSGLPWYFRVLLASIVTQVTVLFLRV